ncbi:MAG: SMP-30/gluconolactonase/LRE family protein [Planctomycetes bacterium]|nr:SMP-30/gluconolactonase/LRE family protein [Planctomycetota bacterium]
MSKHQRIRLTARTVLAAALWIAGAAAFVAQEEGAPASKGVGPAGEVQRVAGGLTFTEGPAADEDGNLYFTDVRRSLILKLDAAGRMATFLADTDRCNGLVFAGPKRLLACQGGAGKLIAIDLETRAIKVRADGFDGVRFNAPNDLVADATGGVYFTDPVFGQSVLHHKTEAVYYVAPDGRVTRVLKDRAKPNGISLSPDGKTLYVLHSSESALTAFPVEEPGRVGAGKRLGPARPGDGMTLDEHGNLYLTQPADKIVLVLSPTGDVRARIEIPEAPTNCTFGGKDRRTLFVTARTSVYAVPMHVRGHPKR